MGFELTSAWTNSNQGFTATAVKDGKKFFLKRYASIKKPKMGPGMSDTLFAKRMQKYERFTGYRIRVNTALQEVGGPGGNIIYPTEWYEEDVCFVEATEFVEGLLDQDAVYALSKDEKCFWAMTGAATLNSIHAKNLVHSDLKPGNIVAARLPSGKIVAKLLDFDISFFADDIIGDPGGTKNYMAPELVRCSIEECSEESLSKLSVKADIFSLGIVLYNYLTNGRFPTPVEIPAGVAEDSVFAGEILTCGGKIKIGSEIEDEYLRILIANMLHPDPESRPTAAEVVVILREKTSLPLKSSPQIEVEGVEVAPPAPVGPIYCEPWEEHAVTFDYDAMKAAGIVGGIERYAKPSGAKVYKAYYQLGGNATEYKLDMLLMLGWARRTGATPSGASASASTASRTSETPAPKPQPSNKQGAELTLGPSEVWPEHADYVIDLDIVKSKGGVGYVQATKPTGAKGYALLLAGDKGAWYQKASDAVMLGFLKKK